MSDITDEMLIAACNAHNKSGSIPIVTPESLRSTLDAVAPLIRAQALEEAVQAVKGMKRCPFEGPCDLGPDDPCPVCGDTAADAEDYANARCQSPEAAIRALKE